MRFAKTPDPGVTAAEQARAELYDTLGQLRERLDYAKRIDQAVDRGKKRLRTLRSEKPLVFAGAVVGVAVVIGAAAWGFTRTIIRKS